MATRGRPRKDPTTVQPPSIPDEFIHFDQLPDSAYVRLPVVQRLLAGCSASAIWRNAKAGNLPAPVRLAPNISAWNVGALRRHLAQASIQG